MSRPVGLVIDSSASWVNHKARQLLSQWGVSEPLEVASLLEPRGESLFEEPQLVLFDLPDAAEVRRVAEYLSAVADEQFHADFPAGVLFTTTVNKNTARTLCNNVEQLGGTVYRSGKYASQTTRSIVAETALPKTVKDYLIDYAGEDYETVIALVESISSLPPKAQKNIGVEDVALRMPAPPGAVPLYRLDEPFVAGDVATLVPMLRRAVGGMRSPIPAVVYLLGRVRAYYELSLVPGMTDATAAQVTGLRKGFSMKKARENAARHDARTWAQVLSILTCTERQLKGGRSGHPMVNLEAGLAEAMMLLRSRGRP